MPLTRSQIWQTVQAQLQVPPPPIGSAPCTDRGCMGAVGLPVWLWITDTAPRSRSISLGGMTMTATARLDRVTWAMGDGTTVTCAGPNAAGTPYQRDYGITMSPTCGHRYTNQGTYPVTAQASWTVTWDGAASGTDALTTSSTVPIRIGEYQAITS